MALDNWWPPLRNLFPFSKKRKFGKAAIFKLFLKVLNDELIAKNMVTIVEMENSGLIYMLLNERIQGIWKIYRCLSFNKIVDIIK